MSYFSATMCTFTWTIKGCGIAEGAPIVPLSNHPKNYWQIKVDGYKYGLITSKRLFNAIFSSTTVDLHIPEVIFNKAVKKIGAKKDNDGYYTFECESKNKVDDIIFNIDGKRYFINGTHYVSKTKDTCYLHYKRKCLDFGITFLSFLCHLFCWKKKIGFVEKVDT